MNTTSVQLRKKKKKNTTFCDALKAPSKTCEAVVPPAPDQPHH